MRIARWRKTSTGSWKRYRSLPAKASDYHSFTKYQRKLRREGYSGWSSLAFALLLAATAAVFNLTGLSTGETELVGTFWGTTAIIVSVVYALAMAEMAGVGVVLAREILKMGPNRQPAATTM